MKILSRLVFSLKGSMSILKEYPSVNTIILGVVWCLCLDRNPAPFQPTQTTSVTRRQEWVAPVLVRVIGAQPPVVARVRAHLPLQPVVCSVELLVQETETAAGDAGHDERSNRVAEDPYV